MERRNVSIKIRHGWRSYLAATKMMAQGTLYVLDEAHMMGKSRQIRTQRQRRLKFEMRQIRIPTVRSRERCPAGVVTEQLHHKPGPEDLFRANTDANIAIPYYLCRGLSHPSTNELTVN